MRTMAISGNLLAGSNIDEWAGYQLVSNDETERLGGFVSFSFRFFRQIDFFGVGSEKSSWFAGLFDRLSELSQKDAGFFEQPYTAGKSYRLHEIKWDQPNIPMKRSDFGWVEKAYLENDQDYPFVQFSISRSKGRVIGFFDETSSVFFVLLLDPKHNMQPTKDHGYKVDKTVMADSELELLKARISRLEMLKEALESDIDKLLKVEKFEYICVDKDFFDSFEPLSKNGQIRNRFRQFLEYETYKELGLL